MRKRLSPEEVSSPVEARATCGREATPQSPSRRRQAIAATTRPLLHHSARSRAHRAWPKDRDNVAARSSGIGRRRRGEATERDVVDAMFDAFAEQGAGELIGWITLTRQREALQPVIDTVAEIIADFREAGDERPMDRVTLGLVLLAIGDSLVGEEIASATGQPRQAVREIAVQQIGAVIRNEI